MKTLKMKLLLKFVQVIVTDLEEMTFERTGEKAVGEIGRKARELRQLMINYIDGGV